jgi:hypothetical protein
MDHLNATRGDVVFHVHDERVHRYCVDLSVPPNLLIGEAASITEGVVPWGMAPDRPIWGYIRSYDPVARTLTVAPKR